MLCRIKGIICPSRTGDCLWAKLKPIIIFLRILGLSPYIVVCSRGDKVSEEDRFRFQKGYVCFGSLMNILSFFLFVFFTVWIMGLPGGYLIFLGSQFSIGLFLPYIQNIILILSSRYLNKHLLKALNSFRKCTVEIENLQVRIKFQKQPFPNLHKWCWYAVTGVVCIGIIHGSLIYTVSKEVCENFAATNETCLSSGLDFGLIVISQTFLILYPQAVTVFFFLLCYIVYSLLKQLIKLLEEVLASEGKSFEYNKTRAEQIEDIRIMHGNICKAARNLGTYFIVQVIFIWIAAGSTVANFMFASTILTATGTASSSHYILLISEFIFSILTFVLVLIVDHVIMATAKLPRETLNRTRTFRMDAKSEYQILLFLQRFNDFQTIKISPLPPRHVALLPFGCEKIY